MMPVTLLRGNSFFNRAYVRGCMHMKNIRGILKNKWLLCLLSVALFSAGWYGLTGLTMLVALVPMLLISRGYDSSRRSFWRMAGWSVLTFGMWNVACAWWVWYATPIGVLASSIAQILLIGGIFMIYHYVSKRARPWLSYVVLVCGWIAAEYLYLTGEMSFPWILLGNGFANDTWAVQWYSVTGVFGGSLWVLVANLLVYRAVIAAGRPERKRWLVSAGIFVAVPIIISLVIFWTFREPAGVPVKVMIVQPNIDPYREKFSLSQDEQNRNLLELASRAPQDVDIILMPETAVDDNIWEENVWASGSVALLRDFMREHYPSAQIITGATTYRFYTTEAEKTETARAWGSHWYDVYNSAIAIDSTDRAAIHHKNKLVIGVEKMPYMNLLKPLESFIVDLGGTTGRLGHDGIVRVFRLKKPGGRDVLSAAPICYESVYGEHFARFADRGAQVMFIITNDGWWYDTPGYRQHFSFARLRAIETRRFIARSANTGISGFINPRGDVGQTLGWDERGALTGTVTLTGKTTFYARHGDYIGRIGSHIFILSLIYYAAYRLLRRGRRGN